MAGALAMPTSRTSQGARETGQQLPRLQLLPALTRLQAPTRRPVLSWVSALSRWSGLMKAAESWRIPHEGLSRDIAPWAPAVGPHSFRKYLFRARAVPGRVLSP